MDLILIAWCTVIYLIIGAAVMTSVVWLTEKGNPGYEERRLNELSKGIHDTKVIRNMAYGLMIVFWPLIVISLIIGLFVPEKEETS